MGKRGQVTIFIIIGLVVFALFGAYFYFNQDISSSKISAAADSQEQDAEIISNYVESCLKKVSEEALFERLGLQGGYINPGGEAIYGEQGTIYPPLAVMQGKKVPHYLEGTGTPPNLVYSAYLPELSEIEKKLENYVLVEFENCFKQDAFNELGYEIEKPNLNYQSLNFDLAGTNVEIDAKFNKDDVSIYFKYPITAKLGATQTVLEEFNAILPIAFKSLYESAETMVEKARNSQPNSYDISADCSLYDKNGLTNVYLKISEDGSSKVVQLVDFSTYENYYFNSYIFQFAVRNVNIIGNCVG